MGPKGSIRRLINALFADNWSHFQQMSVNRQRSALRLLSVLALILIGAATKPVWAQLNSSERHDFRLVTLTRGLVHPWSLAFLPNGDMLVTERVGRLRIIRDGSLDPVPVPGVPEVALGGQGGLLSVALHPRFTENHMVYLSYTATGEGGKGTQIARARFLDGQLIELETLLEVTPRTSHGRHYGSRLLFDRDGYLYATFGDHGRKIRAQDLNDLAGSVIRVTDNGEVPTNNPYVERPDARPEIFTLGNRNPQGVAVHPESGQIWAAEHGPKGGDEINILSAGKNYGWPVITYGKNYLGQQIGEGTSKPGMEQPIRYWVPSISPSGMAFYSGDNFPNWKGNLFLGALTARALVRMELEGAQIVHEERLLEELGERIRDVRQGPDGLLYLLTDASSGALLRLEPVH